LPSPLQTEEEKSLRERSEAIIDELQQTVEGRQILDKPSISGILQRLIEENKKEKEEAAAAAAFSSIPIADAFLPEGWQARQDRCARTHMSAQSTSQTMKRPVLPFAPSGMAFSFVVHSRASGKVGSFTMILRKVSLIGR
jgi:hypothetical protein